jgi:hypothetical protein
MKVNINSPFRGLSGKLGNFVLRNRGGRTFLVRKPGPRTKELTRQQDMIQNKFTEASIYAKSACQEPFMKEQYQKAAKKGQSAYNLAMKDYLKKPDIISIDATHYKGRPKDIIIIRAIDDFKVVAVKVRIYSPERKLIEEGHALMQKDNYPDWEYVVTQHNKVPAGCIIYASAYDIPWNEGALEVVL